MRVLLRLTGIFFGLLLTAVIAVGVFTFTLMPELPSVESLKDVQLKVPLRVYDADGGLIAEFGDERREPVRIDQVPKPLIDAILAAEDDAFYSHPGVDFAGVLRAALANLRSGSHEQGASTITMQVARNYFLSREKTYTRKLKEALLAFRLEQALSKDQILELYLNKIFLGHRAYGFAAAGRVYYGKSLDQLDLPQMAMLAGLPKAPSRDNPLTNSASAKKRRNYVLRRMASLGYLESDQLEQALISELTASKHAVVSDVEAPYIAEMVRDYMLGRYGEESYWRGYKVYTTIIAANQVAAHKALRKGLKSYDRRHGYRGPVAKHQLEKSTTQEELDRLLADTPASGELRPAIIIAAKDKTATAYTRHRQVVNIPWAGLEWARRYETVDGRGAKPARATDIVTPGDVVYVEADANKPDSVKLSQLPLVAGGVVSLRPNDGAVLALGGGFDFYLSKFNRVTQAERQPGSNIKPFIYSAALDNGFTPASLVSGAPIVVADSSQDTVWRPENYSRKFFGPTRLRKALSLSLNLVSVRILRAMGVETALSHLSKFGFDANKLPRGLSLALGSGMATPMTVVTAYAVFANGGYKIQPYFIHWIEDQFGNMVEQAKPPTVCSSCVRAASSPVDDAAVEPSERPRALRVLDADNHFLIADMMRQVIRSGTGRRALQLKRSDLAGKTGTTNDYRDAWFSGFSADVVTTVWVGFDDSKTLGKREAGSKAALPIWIDYMRTALKGTKETRLTPTDNVVSRFVDKNSGEVVAVGDPDGYLEYFKMANAPDEVNGFRVPGTNGVQPARRTQGAGSTDGLF